MKYLLPLFCLLFYKSFSQNILKNEDQIFKSNIKTVLLYPHSQSDYQPKDQLKPSVLMQNSDQKLLLEFDDLSEQYQNYHVKILPMSIDWKPLRLNEVEYISEYNDFIINEYQMSFSTKVPYYHYRFDLPNLKIAGNYLVYVYLENNKSDFVLSKRFMVNANKVGVSGQVKYATNLVKRNTHQQLDFEVKYTGNQIMNPKTDLKIVIRQNFRWEKTLSNLKPQFDRAGEGILDFSFYNGETDFEGGNEFRFFDTRSLRSRMVGIGKIDYLENGYNAILYIDRLQAKKSYVFTDDFDGQYLIDHYENGKGEIIADYANVVFSLENQESDTDEYYVVGAFNDYNCNESNRLIYDQNLKLYKISMLLKQGIYNYSYATKNPVTNTLVQTFTEGNHSKTQNTYEIFVYYKPFGGRFEQLLGYKILEFNNR